MKRNKSLNRKKAISLIVLVITIIIIVIIATTGVVLVAKSGIFHSSTELTFKNDMSQYSDRIKNYFGSKVSDENENIRISGENLVEYIPELKDSKYLDKLYVLDGELVIDGSKITEDEKNWAKEIGIHVSDSLEIIGLDVVTTENTIEIKSINTSGNIPKGVKYKFKLDDNEKESTTSSYTFDKLESGKYYLVNVSIVSSEGQELASYKKNIKTRINNDVVDIKLSTENWTKGPIKVTLEYENIPQAYKIQYKIGKEEFKDYTKEFEVTENNTFIYARLYNKDVGRDTSNNYVEIKNIDKEVPLKPTAISATSGINSIKVRASGSQDSLSGILGYKYSLDGITYTSAIRAYEDYTFTNINADTIKTIYTKAVDNVGNESEVYSKDWATWEASEKVKISIDPSEDLWTNKAVTVSLSHQSIPTNYIMQYRINNGSWTDGYTAKVTENRTKIEARLYNKNLNDEIGLNSLTIGNIDRIVPNVISAEFNPTKNTIEVSNIVAKDEGGSGIANYELSIKKHSDIYYTPYTSEQNKYTFEGLVKDTLYDIHIRVYDKAGNFSDYYSKSIPTVCTITLDSQGADSGKEGTKTIYEKYEKGFYDTEDCTNKITSISIPKKTGFVFDGYYTEKNGKGTKMIDGAGNITSNLKNSYYTSAGTLYANWVAKKITVIFMRNTTADDTTSDTQEFTYGVTGQSFSAKGWTKKGYTLLGWHEDKNSTAKRYSITSGVQDTWIESKYDASSNHTVTLYAIWQPNTYTVKYNGNGATGGTTANSSHTYDVDKKLTKNGYTRAYTVTYNHNYTGSTNTTKTATYSFVNWNTAANGTGTSYANEATVKNLTSVNNGVVNLYAIWKSASINYVPTRTGYVFDGWFEDAECTKRATSSNGVYTPTANKTLYAKWIANTYTVKYNGNNATGGTTADSLHTYDVDKKLTKNGYTRAYTVTYNHNYTGSTNTTKTATYSFANWNTKADGTGTKYENEATVKNLTAVNNGVVNLYAIWNSASVTYVPTRTGYAFGGWFEDAGCTKEITDSKGVYTPTANKTLYAKWIANTYTVKYNGNGATGGTTANSSHTYDVDKKLTKNGYTRAYTVTYDHNYTGSKNTTRTATYSFVNWNTAANGTGTSYANEATVKNLTSVNNGVVNLYAIWKSASINYVPTRTGYVFDGWFEDAECTKRATSSNGVYTPTANKTLYAKWIANTYTVKYNGNGATGGTTADSLHTYDVDKKLTKNGYTRAYTVTYNHNYTGSTNTTKTATYSFVNWNTAANGTGTSYANEATVKNLTSVNNGVVNLYAIWKSASINYVPTRTGYVFDGWFEDAECTKRATSNNGVYTPTANKILYAKWIANTYTVKYNGNGATGGTTANSSHTYDVDKKLTKNGYTRAYTITYNHNYTGSTNTTKTATYSFVNWNTAANGTGTSYANEATVKNLTTVNNGVVNLYAIWNSASVTYVPTRTGYAFGGWFEDAGCTKEITDSKGVYTPTANKTLYAKWIANTYTVKYNGNNATGGTTASSSHTYDVDKKLTKNGYTRAYTITYNHNYTGSTNTTKTATYSFVNWNTAANGTGTSYANEATVKNLTSVNNGVVNLYAIWKSASINYVPTRTGYVFDGWFEDANCTKRATSSNGVYTPTANKTLYAKWTEKYILITYYSNGATEVGSEKTAGLSSDKKTSTKTTTVTWTDRNRHKNSDGTYGEGVNLWNCTSLFSREGYAIPSDAEAWLYNSATSTTYINQANQDFTDYFDNGVETKIDLYANWQLINYTISYNLNNGSFSSQPPTKYNVNSNTVTLLTPTRAGYTFDGWTGSNGTTKQKTVTIPKGSTGNKNYTANWTANKYKVTLDSNGGEDYLYEGTTFDVTYGSKYVNLGYFISGSPPTKTGYVFDGWYTAGGTNVTASSTVSTAKNHTLYAHWTEKHILITYYSNGATKVGSEETAGLSSDKKTSTKTTTVTWTDRNRHKNSDGKYGEGVNLWNCTSLFSRPGYHIPSNAKAWRLGASNSNVYINQASQDFTNYFGDGVETKINLYANWEAHKYGAYETSSTEHWKTCSVCKAVVSGNHSLSGSACGSTDLIIPKDSYSGTKDSFGRFIYDAKCQKCGGKVDYHSKADLGNPSADITDRKFSRFTENGKTYGYDNCPKKKCSTCGGWFDP